MMMAHGGVRGVHGEAPGSVRRQRKRTGLWTRAFIVVSAGRNQHGRVSRFQMGYLNEFSELRGIGTAPVVWYLPLVIRTDGQWPAVLGAQSRRWLGYGLKIG